MTVCLPIINLGNFKCIPIPPVSIQHCTIYPNYVFLYLELSLLMVRTPASIIVDVFTYLVSPLYVTNFQSLHIPLPLPPQREALLIPVSYTHLTLPTTT